MWAEVEVVKFEGVDDAEAEKKIIEFFGRSYVVRAAVDLNVAEKARYLVRTYKIKPPDAVHVATALVHNVPIMETFDGNLVEISGKEGSPLLVIRTPLYEGPKILI
jgi:predicted nucleic acid-binding protein